MIKYELTYSDRFSLDSMEEVLAKIKELGVERFSVYAFDDSPVPTMGLQGASNPVPVPVTNTTEEPETPVV